MSQPIILLVEDEVDLLQVMESALGHKRPHLQVHATRSAEEAATMLTDLDATGDALAMAIVDYRLGKDNGLDILYRVRERHPDAAALMVTGQAPPDAERKARAVGARVMWKPLDLGLFLSTVDALLAS